jgi:hypothetical protein
VGRIVRGMVEHGGESAGGWIEKNWDRPGARWRSRVTRSRGRRAD